MSEHPECDKLSQHTEEFNVLFMFLEWLKENSMCIGAWRDPDAPYYNTFTEKIEGTIRDHAEWLLEHPYPISMSMHDLLYKYLDVDPHKLEMERREILLDIQVEQQEEQDALEAEGIEIDREKYEAEQQDIVDEEAQRAYEEGAGPQGEPEQ